MNVQTLIHLVSDQAMPNLLAAMALKPSRIIHCCTPSMIHRGTQLASAYRAAGIRTKVLTERLSAMPQPLELRNTILRLVDESPAPAVLNFTGGTKLMSLGAFTGALNKKIHTLYVDTDDGIFVDGGTAPNFRDLFEGGDISLSPLKHKLNVHTLAIANGCGRVTNGEPWQPYQELADLLLNDPDLERECHDIADRILKDEPRKFQQKDQWWERQLTVPMRFPEEVLSLGQTCGFFETKGNDVYLAEHLARGLRSLDTHASYPQRFGAYLHLQKPFSFFHGVWWEIAVMRHLSESGLYRDLRWSAKAGSRGEDGTDMEEDILGVEDVNLLYVSCKRGGHKAQLSRTVEDVNSSAERLGGRFTRKILAVYQPLTGKLRSQIEARCAELRIRLLGREYVYASR